MTLYMSASNIVISNNLEILGKEANMYISKALKDSNSIYNSNRQVIEIKLREMELLIQ